MQTGSHTVFMVLFRETPIEIRKKSNTSTHYPLHATRYLVHATRFTVPTQRSIGCPRLLYFTMNFQNAW